MIQRDLFEFDEALQPAEPSTENEKTAPEPKKKPEAEPKKEPEQKAAPRKLFYRIQEVAKMTELKPHVLRYWEKEFKELSPEKDSGDQRRYRERDIELIQRIKRLLHEEKYTIAGARQKLKEEKRARARKRRAAKKSPERAVLRSVRKELKALVKKLESK